MKDILIVGIAGGSVSGKTTVVNKIKEFFGDGITVIGHDNYYKAHDDMTYEEKKTHTPYGEAIIFTDTNEDIKELYKMTKQNFESKILKSSIDCAHKNYKK